VAAGPGLTLEHAFREEWGAVVATLARRLGDLQAAEDAVAEAFTAAAEAWAKNGVPPNPGGWLTVTAWRKAVDAHRARRAAAVDPLVLSEIAPAAAQEATVETQAAGPPELGDDRLGLIFACCHPALALEVRIAMTLRYVAGLTTKEIAVAFLVPEPTLAQRLVRAKRKIKDAGIRFEVPGRLTERLSSVRTVVYLVFNEGFTATSGTGLIRDDLCDEAIWLGRLLHRLLPADAETAGLLALMLLHHARAAARLDDSGRPVPLAEQDRWDRGLIAEGTRVLDGALARREPGTYQLQAAIAALHAQAASVEETDWPQIALLYGALSKLDPSPVVEVNRAVAVGMADGPLAGLAVLEPVLAAGTLQGYSPLHAAHAALLEKAGYPERARGAWTKAAETSASPALREELLRRHEKSSAAPPEKS
jgi:RNA polymerase sigma-70 factor, ECF subfamily